MNKLHYSFCVLVIEDEKPWSDFISAALKEKGIRYKVAATIKEAHDLLDKHRFHLISCDMRMPFNHHEKADVLFGVSMTREIHDSGYLTMMKVYSSQAGSHVEQTIPSHAQDIYQLSGAIGTEIYRKSITDKSQGRDLTPEGYAEKIKKWLFDERSNFFYLKAAKLYLPPPIAQICDRLIDSWDDAAMSNNHWLAWIDLYQALLYLCWAQLLSVLDSSDKFPIKSSGHKNGDAKRIDDIEIWLLAARKVPGVLAPWKPFFMDPKDCSDNHELVNSNLGDGLLKTLQSWQSFRIEKFHDKMDVFERENHHKIMFSEKMRLTDLLAFWCSHPLLNHYEFQDSKGTARAWPIKITEEYTETQIENASKYEIGHIYTQWQKNENGSITLIDLWPWLHEETKPGSSQKTLFCFSHTTKNPDGTYKFYRRSFTTNKIQEFTPGKGQKDKYLKLVG